MSLLERSVDMVSGIERIPHMLISIGLGVILGAIIIGALSVILFGSFIDLDTIVQYATGAAGIGALSLLFGLIFDSFFVEENC